MSVIRPLSRASLILDIVGAFALFVIFTPVSWAFYAPGGLSSTVGDTVGVVMMVVAAILQCGGVAVGRLAPGLALAAAWAGAIVQMVAGLGPLPFNFAILTVLYATAAWGSTRVFWAGLISAFVGGIVAGVYLVLIGGVNVGTFPSTSIGTTIVTITMITILSMLALGAPWFGGFGWRMVLRWRASREAQTRAETLAAEEQERVRIARDMHDVVAHSLAVVIAQSDGARYAAAANPELAQEALVTISQTARSALSDVRMLLTQLRHRQGDGPQPTLADLETLFTHVRQAGIEPRVTIDPMPPGEPPAAIQLAVYRILQDALTNAIRHGEGDVDVKLAWHADRVDLEVHNRAAAAPTASGGHGLVGMRERAQLVGGTFSAQHESETFVVRVTLPIGPSVA